MANKITKKRALPLIEEAMGYKVYNCVIREYKTTGPLIEFETGQSLTFAQLDALSEKFNTKKIDINAYTDGCPTCGGPTVAEITIYEPKI